MARSLSNDQVTGIALIVLGILAVAGGFGWVVLAIAGIALVVYGILILLRKAKGPAWLAVLCIVGGVLLLAGHLPILEKAVMAITWVVGVVLIVVGIFLLMRK